MLRHVAGLAEIVDDFPAAVAFYRDTLGLEVKEQTPGDYAIVTAPGVLHFGVWNRAHAAECTLGDRQLADQIPLGFTLEFEVESVEAAADALRSAGVNILQLPKTESWGQKSCRIFSPGGSILGFAETPWGRNLTQSPKAESPEANE